MDITELITREQVRDLYARYNHAGDLFELDVLASCFADDGVLEVPGRFRAEGREQIEATLTKVSGSAPGNPDFLVRHYVANLRFDLVSADRVETKAYFLVCHKDAPDHWGTYQDVLLPSGDGWAFAHRTVTIEGGRPGTRAL